MMNAEEVLGVLIDSDDELDDVLCEDSDCEDFCVDLEVSNIIII